MHVAEWGRGDGRRLQMRRAPAAAPAIWRTLVVALVSAGAACGLAGLVVKAGPVIALAMIVVLAGAVGLLVLPEVATLATVFLLYVNFPAILTKQYGLPDIVAG